ncbi:MAG: TRAP transporter large permease [Candidatus Lambdaproteobacteria bacterium]|nr:TRAP transporter large permease [Candidatus Lambdaproteobacteria bacterium]
MTGFLSATAFMLVMLFAGVWVAIALGTAGFVGLYDILGYDRVIRILGNLAWDQTTNYVLIAVPLFIFMGEILFQAGIMDRVYGAASRIFRALPGGLLQTNIAASTLFAACSGSSVASAATIGAVGYPQIRSRGYNKPLALGSIAAGGTLGILIPPSILFIIYGSLAEVSIGQLFLAGVLPGLILAVLFAIYIAVRVRIDPALAPKEEGVRVSEMLFAVLDLWQMHILAIVVLGGIYAGVASPTEVAGLGAFLALVFAAIERRLTLQAVITAGINSVRQTCMILFIVMTAKLLALTLVYFQVPTMLVDFTNSVGASRLQVLVAVCVLYVIMGMFFDGLSMMVITIPFVVPVVQAFQVDLIWLGVLVCILIEIGLLTPPVGINLFVLQGATGEPFKDIAGGSLPFVALQGVGVVLLFLFPSLALYLPSLLF